MHTEVTEEGEEGMYLVIGSEPLHSEPTDMFLVGEADRLPAHADRGDGREVDIGRPTSSVHKRHAERIPFSYFLGYHSTVTIIVMSSTIHSIRNGTLI